MAQLLRALGQQSAALNQSRSAREWLDFTYQFLDVVFGVAVVALALYLLWRPGDSPFRDEEGGASHG